MDLGTVGVWWSGSWDTDGAGSEGGAPEDTGAADGAAGGGWAVAGELERLGFGAIFSTGGFKPGLSGRYGRLLASTRHLVVASGIVSIWLTPPDELAGQVTALAARYGDRFLLGLGASHAPVVEGYRRPYSHMVTYLDALDRLGPVVAPDRRMLAALGPRMLELAATRAAGAHPYFVPVDHTALARRVMGPGPLLAVELSAVLDPVPDRARRTARAFTTGYLTLPNYADNLRSLGFTDDDVAGGGSDRLVDAVMACGDAAAVAARVREHLDAGADHVCLQIVGALDRFPLEGYRALAAARSGG